MQSRSIVRKNLTDIWLQLWNTLMVKILKILLLEKTLCKLHYFATLHRSN